MRDISDAQAFWDRESATPTHVSWLENERVREHINTIIGRGNPQWPMDWFEAQMRGRRFRRALSIGCGMGALERDLIRRDLCQNIDAFDGSVASLIRARTLAVEAGISSRVHYFALDFNEPYFPAATYDLVCVHQALHHVAKLEKLFRVLLRSLVSDGVLYIDEYVGPSRTSWSDDDLARQRAIYAALPEAVRTTSRLPLPIQMDDPSEAIRSDEIVPQLSRGFRITARADYGGNVLAPIYPEIRWDMAEARLIDRLIDAETEQLASGAHSYYTILVARPVWGMRRPLARMWYYLEPKLRALRVKILRRLGVTVRY